MRRDVYLYITREDFLSIKSIAEHGTLIDGRRYAQSSDPEKQLALIGQPDKTGEGIINKVFFFEYESCNYEPEAIIIPTDELGLRLVSAEIVDHYPTEQELQKEVALVRAKIGLNGEERDKSR